MPYLMPTIPPLRSKEYLAFVEEENRKAAKQVDQFLQSQITPADIQQYKYLLYEMKEVWSRSLHLIDQAAQNPTTAQGLYFNVLRRDDSGVEKQAPQEMLDEFATYVQDLPKKTGYNLNPATGGVRRFMAFALTQNIIGHHRIDESNLSVYFRVLVEGEVFASNELQYDASWIAGVEKPADVPSTADFEGLSLLTNEGQIAGRKIVEHLWAGEIRNVLVAWLDDMMKRFQFNPTESQMQEIKQFIESRNLDARNPAHLDRARVAFTRAGRFPERCLLEQELRSLLLDRIDTGDRETTRLIRTAPIDTVKDWMKRTGTTIY